MDKDKLKEGEALCIQLMQQALGGANSNFEFIRCWEDRSAVNRYILSNMAAVNLFNKLVKTTYKTYLKQIDLDQQDIQALLALKQFETCRAFYAKEIETLRDMIDEHNEYMLSGHILDTLVGNIRPDEDLVDFRKIDRWI